MPQANTTDSRQLVGDEAVQELGGTSSSDSVVRERPVAETSMVDDALALGLHCRVPISRPVETGHLVLQVLCFGVEPIRSLPAMRKAELRATRLQGLDDVLLWTIFTDHRPCARSVFVEVCREVVPPVSFLHLVLHPLLRGPGTVAGRVGLHELVGGLAVDHPVNQVSAQPSTMRNSIGLGASIPIVGLLMRGANEVVAIGRPASRTIENGLDSHGFQLGNQRCGSFHAIHEALQVALEEMVGQLRRHGALPLARGQLHLVLALVRADEHAVTLVAEVVRTLQVTDDRQLVAVLRMILLHLGNGLGDDVLMLNHGAGSVDAREVADALRPETSAIDDLLGLDDMGVTRRQLEQHLPRAVRLACQADDFGVFVDLSAQGLGLGGKGLGHGGGIDVTIALCPQGGDHAIGVDERVVRLRLFRGDEVHLRAVEEALVELRLRERVVRLLETILVLDEAHGARLVEGQLDAVLVLPLLVELDTFLVPEFEVVSSMVVSDETCGMPGGAGGQGGLLEDGCGGGQALQAQVVQNARTSDSATDDRDLHFAG
mmetsp:Transcript_79700/g.174830  ORF Transcript_79700/g.174830 Transcript_79700/m.174830 type:complete len:545 (+) Transcript_79700:1092-2726(+)